MTPTAGWLSGLLLIVQHDPHPSAADAAAQSATPPRSRYSLTVGLDPPRAAAPLPKPLGPAAAPLIVIDAGHGGHDPGASGPGELREKGVTLAIAKAIRTELLATGRFRVALTRDTDRFLALEERSDIARALKADLFLSIHADSADVPGASGATLYTLSETASDAVAARLANRENRADVLNGVNLTRESGEVSSILIDLARRGTLASASRFADRLYRVGSATIPFRTEHARSAGFVVLKALDTPAVLFEVGYLSNAQDAARLASPAGQAAIAVAVRRAVDLQLRGVATARVAP